MCDFFPRQILCIGKLPPPFCILERDPKPIHQIPSSDPHVALIVPSLSLVERIVDRCTLLTLKNQVFLHPKAKLRNQVLKIGTQITHVYAFFLIPPFFLLRRVSWISLLERAFQVVRRFLHHHQYH